MKKQKHCRTCKCILNNDNFIKYKTSWFCTYECLINFIVKESHKKFPEENKNSIECKICTFRGKSLANHINVIHKINVEEYKSKFKCEIATDAYKQFFSDKIKGEKNPGFNHQGKLSPFSKNFIHYTDEKLENVKNKSKTTKSLNPQNENTKIEYYIKNGFNEETSKKLLSERQKTFSLDICVKKYGEIKGIEIWNERQLKWQEKLHSKSNEEIKEINSKKWCGGSTSKAEREIYNTLKIEFKNLLRQFSLKYENDKWFIFDFKLQNKLIEYNGDYWHANPLKYQKDKIFNFRKYKMTAEDVWNKDKLKKQIAINNGYNILTIWENNYNNNKEETISKCINFLKQ
jgi:hypothetical protein